MLEQMREGWDYVRTFRPIRTILLLFALISLMGYPYAVLLPLFAGQVLHGGPATLGWLTGASGIGALVSALSLAVRKSVVGLTRMLQIAAAMLGGALILFGLSHTLWLSLALMVFVGFGLMQGASVSNTIIQSLVPEDKRARVMSYYTMAFFGAAPFGSLLAGALAHRIGAPHTVMVTGAFCVAGSLWFTLRAAEGQRSHAADLPSRWGCCQRATDFRRARSAPTLSTERKNTVNWYNYIACFFAGVFFANVVPHFVQGISGDRFPTPFAHPPGKGLSSPTVNVVWASVQSGRRLHPVSSRKGLGRRRLCAPRFLCRYRGHGHHDEQTIRQETVQVTAHPHPALCGAGWQPAAGCQPACRSPNSFWDSIQVPIHARYRIGPQNQRQ